MRELQSTAQDLQWNLNCPEMNRVYDTTTQALLKVTPKLLEDANAAPFPMASQPT
jgi:hypothetical protein